MRVWPKQVTWMVSSYRLWVLAQLLKKRLNKQLMRNTYMWDNTIIYCNQVKYFEIFQGSEWSILEILSLLKSSGWRESRSFSGHLRIIFTARHVHCWRMNQHKPFFWTFLSLESVLGLDWAPHTALYSALTALGPTCIREIISCQATFASRIHRISTVTPQSINQNKWCAYTKVYNLSTVCQSGAKNQQNKTMTLAFMFLLFWDVSPNLFWAKQNANKMQYVIALIATSHQITIIFHQPVFPWNMLVSSCFILLFSTFWWEIWCVWL